MAASKIATHKAFEIISITVIMLNCAELMSEKPTQPDQANSWRARANTVFLIAYTIEMVIKILSKGFILGDSAYLRDPFNCLDFAIVMISYLTIF